MEYEKIKQLMNDMGNSKLTSIDIDFPDGTKISMKKESTKEIQVIQKSEQLNENKKQIEVAEKELDDNKQNLEQEKKNTDSLEYIEKLAREKLGMYLPNERVYIDSNK